MAVVHEYGGGHPVPEGPGDWFATCSCGWSGRGTKDPVKSFKAHVRRVGG